MTNFRLTKREHMKPLYIAMLSLIVVVSLIIPGIAPIGAADCTGGAYAPTDCLPEKAESMFLQESPTLPSKERPADTRAVLISQDFSSTTFPPTGWAQSGPTSQWSRRTTNNAGGTSPEARFAYVDATDQWRLYCGPIDTTSLASIDLEFRQFIDAFAAGSVTLKVQTSTDLSTWHDAGWSWTATASNYGPVLQALTVSTVDVGSGTFYMAWTVDGYAYNIDYWYIDDVQLSSAETPYSLDFTGRSPGWMFVSYPITVAGNIETVFDDATNGDGGTDWDVAKVFDNVAKMWMTHRKGSSVNTFTDVSNLMGIWLHVTSNGGDQALSILPTGENPAVESITLYTGWNMVGFPCLTQMLASETLPAQADYVSVWQESSPYIQDFTDKSLVTMSDGNGYWIRVTADCVWTVETIPPPTLPIRQIAEFERMQGVLIRYPLGISYSVIREMSEDAIVYTVLTNSYLTQAQNNYASNGVNMTNCQWIIATTDSYWTRDYGPWWITDENGEFGIVDFPYNRPRPNDDIVPGAVASFLGVPMDYMGVTHTGGNYMTDGLGISASTDLVLEENTGLTEAQIKQLHQDYLGIDTYHIVPDANYPTTTIKHIDCWGKFLDVDKIIIREVPVGHAQYDEIEAAVTYFEGQTSAYGTPYQVYRVYTPNDEPYSNCLILNDKVLLPIMGGSWDDEAIASYQAAMPGYEVLGFTGSWLSTDALHCRAIGIPDLGTLYIMHYPVIGPVTASTPVGITANITAYSGSALTTYELHWKLSTAPTYNTVAMTNVEFDQYTATIPGQASGATIQYYISASDASGRTETHPIIGSPDPHVFTVA